MKVQLFQKIYFTGKNEENTNRNFNHNNNLGFVGYYIKIPIGEKNKCI